MRKLIPLTVIAILGIAGCSSSPADHIQVSSTDDQAAPGVVQLNSVDSAQGASLDGAEIVVDSGGTWVVVASPQVGSVENGAAGSVSAWLTVNGEQVSNSNVLWKGPKGQGTVLVSQGALVLEDGDRIAVEWDSNGPELEALEPVGAPVVPSIILTAVRTG